MFLVLFKIGERIPGRRNSRCTGPKTGDACGPSRKCKHVGTNGQEWREKRVRPLWGLQMEAGAIALARQVRACRPPLGSWISS